jgi:hypothetical protein
MTLRLKGSTSGHTEIKAPASAGSNTITLPTGNGSAEQFLKNSGTAGELEFSSMVETSTGVGVGTSSPATKFVVSNGGAEGLEFGHASGTNEVNSFNRSNNARVPVDIIGQTFKVLTGNPSLNTGLFQDSSGNVGIGVTNIDSPLEVAGTGPSLVTIHHSDGGTNDEARLMLGALSGNQPDNRGAGITALNNGAGHDLVIKTSSSHSAGPTEKMRIDNTGRVKCKAGSLFVQTPNTGNTNTDGLLLNVDGNTDAYLWNYENTSLRFGTNNAERTRIDAGGTVFTRHPTSTSLIVATGGAASGSNPVFAVRRSSTAITTGTNVFFVYSNGSYATISDQSKKKNIESTRDGYLDDLNRLRVVKYNWNEQEDTDPKELGLIAQEVEEVFPGLISQMNEDGEETTKGIKYSVLPVMLLKALQEAIAKIETLEQRLSDAGIA